jgi:ribosome assembly protein RRB1
MKMHNLRRTSREKNDEDDDDDAESDSDDSIDGEEPEMETAIIEHNGSVNRVRVCQQTFNNCNHTVGDTRYVLSVRFLLLKTDTW